MVHFFYRPTTEGQHIKIKKTKWAHMIFAKNKKNILNKLLKYSSITRQLFNIFLHEFLVEFRAQGVINEAFLFTWFIHSFSAVFKHNIIVPPARNKMWNWVWMLSIAYYWALSVLKSYLCSLALCFCNTKTKPFFPPSIREEKNTS